MNSVLLFCLLYAAYFLSYVSRKNIVFVAPHLLDKGFTKGDLGASQSAFSVCYMISKLYGNIICNWTPPYVVLSLGVTSMGIVNIAAGILNAPEYLWVLWGINGLCCGICWPPIAVLIVSNFREESRGKIWSLVSSSMNAGATVSPIVTDFLVLYGSWNMSFYLTGIVDVLLGVILLVAIEPVEDSSNAEDTVTSTPWNRSMLLNSFIITVCSSYAILVFSVIAMGTWGQMFFIEKLGISTLSAGSIISVYEVGGFCGATASGFLADYLAKILKNKRSSPRSYSAMIFTGVACAASFGLHFQKDYVLCQICAFGYGCGAFGALAMFGLMVREFVPREHGGTLSGALALAQQMGGFSAGSPLAWYNESFSVGAGLWVVACLLPIAFLLMSLVTRLDGKYKAKEE